MRWRDGISSIESGSENSAIWVGDKISQDNISQENTHKDNTHKDDTYKDDTYKDNTYKDNTQGVGHFQEHLLGHHS